MDYCFKCGKSEEEVKLLDAVSLGEIVKICEECSETEDMPIIKKPTIQQLKESEKSYGVYERLSRMAGLEDKEKEEVRRIAKEITDITLDDLREKKESEKQEKEPLRLIENFHWHISMSRKKKKLTRKELADLLGESETAIRMVENKELPGGADKLIRKLEQFFGIKLRKEPEGKITEKPDLRREEKKEEIPEKVNVEMGENEEKEPARILKFDRESIKNITIADLRRMKEEKEEKEKLERQKKMETDRLIKEIEKEEKVRGEEKWKQEVEKSLLGNFF